MPVVRAPVCFVHPGGIWICRTGAIGIHQQTLNGKQDRTNILTRRPSLLNHIQTQSSIIINIRMKHVAGKTNAGRTHWIVFTKRQSQRKYATFPWRVLRSENRGVPHAQVVVRQWTRAASSWWVFFNGFEIGEETQRRNRRRHEIQHKGTVDRMFVRSTRLYFSQKTDARMGHILMFTSRRDPPSF